MFAAIEKLSRTLQAENTTLQEPTAAVTFAKAYYTRLRILSEFNRSFDACITFAEGKITDPVLPRHRRILARLDDGTPAHRFILVKEYYRKNFFEVCDFLVREPDKRFDQVKMKPVIAVEKVLLQASNSQDFQESFQALQASCFRNGFDFFSVNPSVTHGE